MLRFFTPNTRPRLIANGRLIVVCGLPGSGKTTHARALATCLGAVRMAPDVWMESIGVDLYDETRRARIELRPTRDSEFSGGDSMTRRAAALRMLRCARARSTSHLRSRRRRVESMVMAASSPPYLTVEQVLALPDDGNRYELVYGELLVSPSPRMRHQAVAGRLYTMLREHCARERCGRVFYAPADITWGRRDVLVQPDVFVVGRDDDAGEWADVRSVTLAIEVTSPSTRQQDRFRKRLLYRDRGVETYWIVDPDGGFVEVWTPDADLPTVERESVAWHPTGAEAALTIDVAELLAE